VAGFLTTSSILQCPHGGTVNVISTNTRTQAAGSYLLRASDTFTVAGCSFSLGSLPHPCVQVKWEQPSRQSQVEGDFTLTEESVGFCIAADQGRQGVVLINFTQAQDSGQ
jgi:hypothetical protein